MNLTRHIINAASALAALLLGSCEKELDFKYHDIDPLTVIEGSMDADGATVAITLTTPMDEPMDRTRLTDATVTLADLSTGIVETLSPDSKGNFISPTPVTEGHTYTLSVKRGDATYAATSTALPATRITGMEFQWIKMPYDYVAVLDITFEDNPLTDGDCYWVRVYRNGEAYMWNAVEDNLAVDGHIDEVLMTSRKDTDEEDDDTVLLDGDVVTATVTPISRGMYDYLQAISNGTSNGPAMFSGDRCLGYFLAAPVASMSTVFHPDQLSEYK